MATVPFRQSFHPGDVAPASGTYRVIHGGHRADHNVLMIQGEEFPRCRYCRSEVRFELLAETEYAAHDWDFAGPNLRLVE